MRIYLFILCLLFAGTGSFAQSGHTEKKIFIFGGTPPVEFIQYIADLTGKERPKICWIPTASGDNPYVINAMYTISSTLNIEPHILRVWINSPNQPRSWEEILTGMDAVIVGGGNTLNMLAIWKAQGIDEAIRKAYENGTVVAGGSAGSLCWFNAGTTDSRPQKLTIVEGLGWLDYSHCPHYHSEPARRPLYHENILSGALDDGYACDDQAGILFVNGKVSQAVSIDEKNNSYYVYEKDGKIVEEKLESVILK